MFGLHFLSFFNVESIPPALTLPITFARLLNGAIIHLFYYIQSMHLRLTSLPSRGFKDDPVESG